MKKGTLVIISTILVMIGLILLVSSLSITGNVISERIGKTTGSILGLMFVIGGFILFMARRAESELVNKTEGGLTVIKTDRFLKVVRRHDPKIINRAILKIGSGKGGEERVVTAKEDFSIKGGKGARVIFSYPRGGESVLLKDYLPQHEYEELRKRRY